MSSPISTTPGASSAPRLRDLPLVAIGGGWLVLELAQVVLAHAAGTMKAWLGPSIVGVAHAAVWTVLTPTLAILAVRYRGRGWSLVPLHVATLAGVSALDTLARRLVVVALGGRPAVPFTTTLLYFLDSVVVAYFASCAIGYAVDARRMLVARERHLAALRGDLAAARLRWLESQLHPHFMFNALSVILELAREAPATAASMLRRLSSLVRSASADDMPAEVPLSTELETLDAYLDIQRLRFADWLRIETHIEARALGTLVPRLLLQPIVENAIAHGLKGRREAGRIDIVAEVVGGTLRIEVRDNGVGLNGADRAPGSGIGLSNASERLRTLYGDAFSLEVSQPPSGGAVTCIELPAKLAAESTPRVAEAAPPRITLGGWHRHPVSATVIAWMLWGVLYSNMSWAFLSVRGRMGETSLSQIFLRDFASAMSWALLTPLAIVVARAAARGEWPRWAVWAAVGSGGVIVAGAHSTIFAFVGGQRTLAEIISMLWFDLLVYAAIALFAFRQQLERLVRDREDDADEARAVAAEMRLEATSRGIDGDAVTARLDSAADLVETQPAAAQRMLVALGDELRAALDALRGINDIEPVTARTRSARGRNLQIVA